MDVSDRLNGGLVREQAVWFSHAQDGKQGLHSAMTQQCPIPPSTFIPATACEPANRATNQVGLVQVRHVPAAIYRLRKALREGLNALRPADCARLPIGKERHKVIQQMLERLPLNSNPSSLMRMKSNSARSPG